LVIGLISGLLVIAVFNTLFILLRFLKSDIQIQVVPNQGVRSSIKNAFIVIVIGLLAVSILRFLVDHWLIKVMGVLGIAGGLIVISLAYVLWFSFQAGGGQAVIQHFALRIILTHHHKIPWNLARFLTYCHDRRLLQQIGGRYRFIHRELLDHFAGMEK
jgi:hypothetical protein